METIPFFGHEFNYYISVFVIVISLVCLLIELRMRKKWLMISNVLKENEVIKCMLSNC